jgi:predicted alpha/beta-fold hydrolase
MINDRSQGGVGPDVNTAGATYWLSDKQPLTDIKNWRQVTQANSQKLLVAAADKFPTHDPTENEKQSHITILVHGFNNKFTSDFMRTFAADFLKNRIVSALVFFRTGRRAGVILG